MRLVKDLGMKCRVNSEIMRRFGLYECPICLELFERTISYMQSRNPKQCTVCSHKELGHTKTHGMSRDKIYNIWALMKNRCLNKNDTKYHRYGGRGITVCKEWLKFENFYRDMGYAPEGMQIDRENNDGNYKKSNCRWVTRIVNVRNSTRAKLIEEDVSAIKTILLYSKSTIAEIGKAFNVTTATIYSIKFGRTWKDICPFPV